jgi:hypothetical protein
VSLFFGQFSHLADKKKVSARNAKPQPRLSWGGGGNGPKSPAHYFIMKDFLKIAIFRQ